ncbi:glutamate synthase [Virgisporangium aliadipatigenens]|uniref:Glutamate synthase n=1 Tax=Virgisporangium aliadipatigenens TaxID=741659 RepID=A0A8J4DRV9_9ACTN|nr:NAD(P)-binding protein [Virgisporangium aliadipatigenens]GIJ48084.1 glutamate synthase [Virgisporangium aliadipatigenens]
MTEHPFAITLDVGSSLANRTGAWRTERPVYVNRMPPCNDACPAGENVQAWLYEAEDGGYERAWRQLVRDNPFPAIMGRVCYHPCQDACNRGQLDEAVGINAVERFVGDEAIRRGWRFDPPPAPTGKRVLVVGAGPCGLSAAYHLAVRGHAVTVRDAGEAAGGMMRYGIPAYRLPRDVLDAEIGRIVDLGVTVEQNRRVDDPVAALAEFDAVFLAVGAQLSKRAYVPAGESARILDALGVLHDVAEGERPLLGRRVVVYGGGNTALDVARSAKRLGATEPLVVYRRTRAQMPAHPEETDEAIEEGVRMRWLSTIAYAGSGRVVVERMRLDDNGFPQPTGEFEELPADAVVLALGQEVDRSIVDSAPDIEVDHGTVRVDAHLMTGRPGVFAGGDMVPSRRTVTDAVGHGKRAAREIDAWLGGGTPTPAARPPLATFERLNTWYYSDAPATLRPRLDLARRASTFDEVVRGLDESTALFEARRCLSCGNCFGCDNCFGVCPDNAVRKLDEGHRAGSYAIDLDYCKGCGICVAECPAGAIEMVPEEES